MMASSNFTFEITRIKDDAERQLKYNLVAEYLRLVSKKGILAEDAAKEIRAKLQAWMAGNPVVKREYIPKQQDAPEESKKDDKLVVAALENVLRHLVELYNVESVPTTISIADAVGAFLDPLHEAAEIINKELNVRSYSTLNKNWTNDTYAGFSSKYATNGRLLVRESIVTNDDARTEYFSASAMEDQKKTLKGSGYDAFEKPDFASALYSEMIGVVFFVFAALLAAKDGVTEFQLPENYAGLLQESVVTQGGKYRSKKVQMQFYRQLLIDAGVFSELNVKPIASKLYDISRQLEIIETLPEYIDVASSVYKMAQIEANLIAPLRDLVVADSKTTHSRLLSNLGLTVESKHNFKIPPGMETKYLHTLSVAAKLIESEYQDDELAARIQTEWPHTLLRAPKKEGVVYDI
jgi:hypothetical protein